MLQLAFSTQTSSLLRKRLAPHWSSMHWSSAQALQPPSHWKSTGTPLSSSASAVKYGTYTCPDASSTFTCRNTRLGLSRSALEPGSQYERGDREEGREEREEEREEKRDKERNVREGEGKRRREPRDEKEIT